MARYIVGEQQNVVYRFESGTFGTPTGANNWLGLVINHETSESQGVQTVRHAGQNSRLVGQFLDGQQEYNNSITFYPQDFRWMQFVFGSSVDGGSPSPYTHNFAPNTNSATAVNMPGGFPLPTFTVIDEKNQGIAGSNVIRTFNGCMAKGMTISIKQGEPIEVTLPYVAQSVTFSSGAIANVSGTDVTRPFMWRDTLIRIPSGTLFNEIKEITLTYDNGLESPHYVDNNRTVGQSIPQGITCTVAATVNATANLTKQLYDTDFSQGGIENSIYIDMNQSTGSEQCVIVCSGAKLTEFSMPSNVEGVQEQTFVFTIGSPGGITAQEFSTTQFNNLGSFAGF